MTSAYDGKLTTGKPDAEDPQVRRGGRRGRGNPMPHPYPYAQFPANGNAPRSRVPQFPATEKAPRSRVIRPFAVAPESPRRGAEDRRLCPWLSLKRLALLLRRSAARQAVRRCPRETQ